MKTKKVNKKTKSNNNSAIIIIIVTLLITLLIVFGVILMNNTEKMDSDIVVFETSMGNIEIKLHSDLMPITTANFKKLVNEGFYDGTKFHRVIDGFMIQGGDPLSKDDSKMNSWGTGGSENIQDEFSSELSNVRGTIAMANTGRPNSGSSQFFINVADNIGLDFDKQPLTSKHPVFGEVISGMDEVIAISKVRTARGDRPLEHVVINKAYLK